jgi:hypothetical protein
MLRFALLLTSLCGITFASVWYLTGRDNAVAAGAWPVYYPSCRWARAFGAAPIHLGERGYRTALDADGDGVACEPYRGDIGAPERAVARGLLP